MDSTRSPHVLDIYVTRHAVDRYRLHHPGADWRDVLDGWDRGTDLEPETASALAGRAWSRRGSWYRLTSNRRGLLVVTRSCRRDGAPFILKTYLRFLESQQRFAETHWPRSPFDPAEARM